MRDQDVPRGKNNGEPVVVLQEKRRELAPKEKIKEGELRRLLMVEGVNPTGARSRRRNPKKPLQMQTRPWTRGLAEDKLLETAQKQSSST